MFRMRMNNTYKHMFRMHAGLQMQVQADPCRLTGSRGDIISQQQAEEDTWRFIKSWKRKDQV